jgi:HKD family nuclease
MNGFRHLMDVATPPAGKVLRGGLWFTYDLDLSVVSAHVAPRLVDLHVADTAERRRRTAAFTFGEGEDRPKLVVVADGRRLHRGPGLPWMRIVPVRGRIQHAKFGLLEFASLDGHSISHRAFVTSANLTRGGVSRNAEFLVVDERVSTSKSPCLEGDLVDALRRFVKSLSDDEVSEPDQRAISQLVERFAAGHPAPSKTVVHSLDAQRPLLGHGASADRIAIVSPAFSSGTAKLVDLLEKAGLSRNTEVVWTLDGQSGEAPAVPHDLWGKLRDGRSAQLRVYQGGGRRLHAKFLSITRSGVSEAVAGSANFTSRGLGGVNRELALRYCAKSEKVELLLSELPSDIYMGEPAAAAKEPWTGDERPLLLPIIVAFAARRDHGRLVGRLEVTVPEGSKVKLKSEGRWYSPEELGEVTLGTGLIEVKLESAGNPVLVPIDLGGVEADLWAEPSERERSVNTELDFLVDLLRRLSAHRTASPAYKATGGNHQQVNDDDKYLERLTQPLVLLARHRDGLLKRASREELGAFLDELSSRLLSYKWDEVVERPIADALFGLPSKSPSPLLQALRKSFQ